MRLALALLLTCAALPAQVVIPARVFLYYAFGDIRVNGAPPGPAGPIADGQIIVTGEGRAEFLLSSGAMLWLDRNSEVRFESAALDNVHATLVSGNAIVEIFSLPKEAHVEIATPLGNESLLRNGLYTFGSESAELRRWAAFRSLRLFVERGRKPANWDLIDNNRLVRHQGFRTSFPAASPTFLYAVDYRAGLVAHIEGEVTLRGARAPRLPMYIDVNAPFATGEGRTEIYLGRGITMRLAPRTQIRMLDVDAAHPAIALDRGVAMLEFAETARSTPLKVEIGNAVIEPVRHGVFLVDQPAGSLLVYDGEARVRVGDRSIDARSSQRVNLATLATPTRFDTKQKDPFFKWCGVRSLTLYGATAGEMGDWKPPIGGQVAHKVFGNSGLPPRSTSLETAFATIMQRTPF